MKLKRLLKDTGLALLCLILAHCMGPSVFTCTTVGCLGMVVPNQYRTSFGLAGALFEKLVPTYVAAERYVDKEPQSHILTGTFNGSTGTILALPRSVDTVELYTITVMPISHGSAIGDIWSEKATNAVTVKCSAGNMTDTFTATIVYLSSPKGHVAKASRHWTVSPVIGDHSDPNLVEGIAWVKAQAGTDPVEVELPGNFTYAIGQDFTIPETWSLKVQRGAILAHAGGTHLTFSPGATLEAGLWQVFDGPVRWVIGANTIKEVYPQWFGARGDGLADDTVPLQNAVNFAMAGKSSLYVPQGTYMVQGTDKSFWNGTNNGGLIIDGGSLTMSMHPDATLKAITSDHIGYAILNIRNSSDVTIQGGKITGERTTHVGSTGEFGYGILVRNSSRVRLRDLLITDCWGDGIMLAQSTAYDLNTDIFIDSVISRNNRRQGMSILAGHRIYVTNSEFSETHGTAPQAGIDIEPDWGSERVADVLISNCTFNDNAMFGVVMGGAMGMENISITNCIFKGNQYGICSSMQGQARSDNLSICNNIIMFPGKYELRLLGIGLHNNNGATVMGNKITKIKNEPQASNKEFGMYFTDSVSNSIISNNTLEATHYGLFFSRDTCSNIKVNNNNMTGHTVGIYSPSSLQYCDFVSNQLSNINDIGIEITLSNSMIAFNTFNNIQGPALNIKYGSKNCSINGNYFNNTALRGHNTDHTIIANGIENSVIDGNIFINQLLSRYAIISTTTPASPNTITNNVANYSDTPFLINSNNKQKHNHNKD